MKLTFFKFVKTGILIVCLLIGNFVIAQSRMSFVLEKNLKTNIPFFPNPSAYSIAYFENCLYWIPTRDIRDCTDLKFNKKIIGYKINLKTDKIDTIELLFHVDKNDYFSTTSLSKIAVTKDFLIMSGFDKTRIFKNFSNHFKEYDFIKANGFHLDNFYKINDYKFACSMLYNFNPNDDQSKLRLLTYDVIQKKVIDKIEKSNVLGIEFTHFPIQMIDSKENLIAISDLTEYKILLLNSNLKTIDTIKLINGSWKNFSDFKIKDYGSDIPKLMRDFEKYDDSISRIEKVFIVNDTSILVIHKQPKDQLTYKRKLDMWTKENNTWKLAIFNQILNYSSNDKDTISFKHSIPDFRMSPPILFIEDNQIITIEVANYKNNKPISRKEYKSLIEEKDKLESRKYHICVYKWKTA